MEFSNARAVVGESDPATRESVCTALRSLRFGEILDAPSLVKLHLAIRRNTPDLIILNENMDGDDTCFITRNIRSGKLGADPFCFIIVLISGFDASQVGLIANSGADDALLLPVPPDALVDKVKALAGPRKPFVVTHDYIGPERRSIARQRLSALRQIDVPNPLGCRTTPGLVDDYAITRDFACAQICSERIARLAAHVVGLAEAAYLAAMNGEDIGPQLLQVEEASKDLATRLDAPYQKEAAHRLVELAKALRGGPVLPDVLAAFSMAAKGVVAG